MAVVGPLGSSVETDNVVSACNSRVARLRVLAWYSEEGGLSVSFQHKRPKVRQLSFLSGLRMRLCRTVCMHSLCFYEVALPIRQSTKLL